MKIAILVEGATEVAFREKLREFLKSRFGQEMPRLDFKPQDGRIPKEGKLRRMVENLLDNDGYDAVIALTDVYTGTRDFQNSIDAKDKMMEWVGHNSRFYPHTALHDFEAWLLPYWTTIQALAKHNRSGPSSAPETVNHQNPQGKRISNAIDSWVLGFDWIEGKPPRGRRACRSHPWRPVSIFA
jgi:Domain of unknown function (DUF4276)